MTSAGLFLTALFLAGPGEVPSPPPPGAWVVLVKTEGAVPSSWKGELQQAGKDAAAGSGTLTIVPPPQVSLDDVQVALGCSAWGADCAGKVAGMMSADVAFVVDVSDAEGGALSWSLVGSGGRLLYEGGPQPLPDLGEEGLAVARSTIRSVVRGVTPTVLILRSDVPGAEVFLDGDRVGITPLTLRELEPGTYKVRLSLEGRAPLTRTVDLPAGETVKETFVMSAGTPPHHEPTVGERDPAPLTFSPLLSWSVLGAGGVALALAGVSYAAHLGLGALYTRYPDDTQVSYYNRRFLPQGVAVTMSYGLYGVAATAGAVGLLLAASGVGLVVASFLTGDEAGEEPPDEPPSSGSDPAAEAEEGEGATPPAPEQLGE